MDRINNKLDEEFNIRQANDQDTNRVLRLLTDTAKWFKTKGSTQWRDLLKGIDTHHTKEAISRGDVFICMSGKELAGMVMLLQSPSKWDQNLWQLTDKEPNDSIYLHRLAINRQYANQQLGRKIVKWCQQHIQFEGKKKLRLDCIAHNDYLNQFYQKADFTYMGEKGGYSLYEYEYPHKK